MSISKTAKNRFVFETVEFVDRETGEKKIEKIYGEAELLFFYHHSLGRRLRRFILGPWFSKLNAIPKKLWFSRHGVDRFVKSYGVNIAEAEKPVQDYSSLDEFFCRKLRIDARPLSSEFGALCSPADARVQAYGIDEYSQLEIKGQRVSVHQLLSLPTQFTQAEQFHRGQALVLRLAPCDYHRFHFPAAGIASDYTLLPGPLESVHPIALRAGAASFMNKRSVTCLDTEHFGRLYLVAVGALTIGSIVHTYRAGPVSCGQEWGYFRFGGSTVVMLWPAGGPDIDEDIWRNTQNGLETFVKCGTRVAGSAGHPNVRA